MVEESVSISHKPALSQQQLKRQNQRITRYRENRREYASNAASRMTQRDCSSKQRTLEDKLPAPANRRDCFPCHRLVTPNKSVALFNHTSKEVLILAGPELRSKRRLTAGEDALAQENISCASLWAVDDKSGRVTWSIVKATFNNPLWCFLFEERFYRTEHAIYFIFVARIK